MQLRRILTNNVYPNRYSSRFPTSSKLTLSLQSSAGNQDRFSMKIPEGMVIETEPGWVDENGNRRNMIGAINAMKVHNTKNLPASFVNGKHHDSGETYLEYMNRRLTMLSTDAEQLPPVENVQQMNGNLHRIISDILRHEKIELNEGESIELTVSGGKIQVSGLQDQDKLKKIQWALNVSHVANRKDLYVGGDNMVSSYYCNTEYASSAPTYLDTLHRADLVSLKSSMPRYLSNVAGVPVELDSFYLDDAGNIKGYPRELAWVFETIPNTPEKNAEALGIKHNLKRLLKEGIDNIPDYSPQDVSFTYSNKEIVANMR